MATKFTPDQFGIVSVPVSKAPGLKPDQFGLISVPVTQRGESLKPDQFGIVRDVEPDGADD